MTQGVGHTDQVRRYYDDNAAAFERLGRGGTAIHRLVWGPGVTTRREAVHYVEERVLEALASGVDTPTVVDLGCGLGASLLYLAGRADLTGEGLTISPRQAARAADLIAAAGVGDRVRVRVGDYLDVPDDLAGRADVTYSIEAFLHSPDPGRYFHQAARTLRGGGRLVLCDDFLAAPPRSPREARWLDEFRAGWRVGSLLTVAEVRDLAGAHGFDLVRDLDLTPHLELRRPRDRFISLLVAAGRPLRPRGEYWQSLLGGNALQLALTRGLLAYRVLELRRR